MSLLDRIRSALGAGLVCRCTGVDPVSLTVIDLAEVPGHVCDEESS